MALFKKKVPKDATIHFFLDESGSPEFYGKKNKLLVGAPGYSPFLIIGMVAIKDKKEIYHKIIDFQNELLIDPELKDIYSLHQPGWFLHAKDDHILVRDRFYHFLSELDFQCYIIIGRKILSIFHNRHNKSEKKFYYELIQYLLKDRFTDYTKYKIYLSKRSGNSQESINLAIERSIEKYNKFTNKEDIEPQYMCSIVSSSSSPIHSIIDYMLWALQRYIKQNEDTYFKLMQKIFAYIYDPYDRKNHKNNKHYTRRNPFDLSKAGSYE